MTSRVWLAVALILAMTSVAEAAPPWNQLPPNDRDIWQRLIGLEAGIAMMHCVQPASAAAGEIDFVPKHYVAIAGCAVYGGNTIALAARKKFALWVNIIGPIVGITAVSTGWILNAAGVIDARVRPDVPQLAGGVLQVWAWIESFRLLSRYHKRGESLLSHPRVVPTPRGAALFFTW